MATSRIPRILSTFNRCTRRWVPAPAGLPTAGQDLINLKLATWNIDAFSPRPVARASAIIDKLLKSPQTTSDVLFLQEVSPAVRVHLLNDARIRAGFFVTDAEDDKSLSNVPFTTMTFLSKGRFSFFTPRNDHTARAVTRFKFPSKYGRDALCTDICLPLSNPRSLATTQQVRLINVHLDSLTSTLHYRQEQMRIVRNILGPANDKQEEGHRNLGLIAGDFNAICKEDQYLILNNGLTDAWVSLYGNGIANSDGWSWGYEKRQNNFVPKRLDRIAITERLEPVEMYVMHPGTIAVPKPGGEGDAEVRWSDHAGLSCRFKIE